VSCERPGNNMSAGDAAPLGYAQRRAMQSSSPLRGSPSKRERAGACSGSCNTHCPGTGAAADDAANMEAQVCLVCPVIRHLATASARHSAVHASLSLMLSNSWTQQRLPCRHVLVLLLLLFLLLLPHRWCSWLS
jgi:hypothetical protein